MNEKLKMQEIRKSAGGGRFKTALYEAQRRVSLFFARLFRLDRKKNKARKKDVGAAIFIVAMLVVPLLNLIIFYFAVNFNSILMAFQHSVGGTTSMSLYNFKMLFMEFGSSSSKLLIALRNTLIFFVLGLIIITPLSLFLSYFLYKKVPGYKIFRFVFFLPNIISGMVLVAMYKQIIAPGGVVDFILHLFGGSVPELGFLASPGLSPLITIIVYTLWTGFGVNIILFNGAMMRVPEEVIESAQLDGVSWVREMFQIIVPMIWPTISTMLTFAFVGLFTASGPILLFTKGALDTNTISFWIFDLVQGVNGVVNLEYASAVGLFFTVIGLPIVLGARWLLGKVADDVEY